MTLTLSLMNHQTWANSLLMTTEHKLPANWWSCPHSTCKSTFSDLVGTLLGMGSKCRYWACTPLRFYMGYVGSCLLTWRDNILIVSSKVEAVGHSFWTAWPMKMGQIDCPKISVNMLCNIPEEWRPQLFCSRCLKSFNYKDIIFSYIFTCHFTSDVFLQTNSSACCYAAYWRIWKSSAVTGRVSFGMLNTYRKCLCVMETYTARLFCSAVKLCLDFLCLWTLRITGFQQKLAQFC
jgi:hypothetical protein